MNTQSKNNYNPVILYISRHEPSDKQKNNMKKIFGEYEIIKLDGNLSYQDILDAIEETKPMDVIANLPWGMIQSLKKDGIRPLLLLTEDVSPKEDYDIIYRGNRKQSKEIKRFLDLTVHYYPRLKIGSPVKRKNAPKNCKVLLLSRKISSEIEIPDEIFEDLMLLYGSELQIDFKKPEIEIDDIKNALKGSYFDIIVDGNLSFLKKLTEDGIHPLVMVRGKDPQNNKKIGLSRLMKIKVDYEDPKKEEFKSANCKNCA